MHILLEQGRLFIELLKPYGIEELARTGVIAMARGTQTAKEKAAAPVASATATATASAARTAHPGAYAGRAGQK